MINSVKDYNLSKDLKGYRELVFKVSDAQKVADSEGEFIGDTDTYSDSDIESYSYTKTDTKVNPDESLTLENYKKAKSIIEERLKKLYVQDYNLSMDSTNGTISLQIPEDSSTDHTISNILQVANFEIRDSEDSSKVFITNDNIKNISAVYNTTETGTTVYLQVQLNKEGTSILKDLSTGEYATKEETSEENENSDANTTSEENTNTSDANTTSEENTRTSDANTTSE